MKHAIISDLHLGVRGDSSIYRKIFIDWLNNFLVPTLKREDVQVLDFLGDFYDNRNTVNVLTQNLGLLFVTVLEKELPNMKIRMLIGNHCCYYRNTREVHSLKKFERFPNVQIIDDIIIIEEGSRSLLYAPWIVDKAEIEKLASMRGKYDTILGHFEFNGFSMNGGYVAQKGTDGSMFKGAIDVFSGHFHKHVEQDNITYVGNPFHMDWNDAGNDKGIYIYNLTTGKKKFIVNNISPVYLKVYLSQLKAKTISLDSVAGNFIKVYLDTEYSDKLVEKLTEVIRLKAPLTFSIEGFGATEIDSSAEVSDNLDSPLETLLAWVSEMNIGDLDKDVLFKKFYEIYNKVVV